MDLRFQAMVSLLVLVAFVSCATARDGRPNSPNTVLAETTQPVLTSKERLTGKERLGRKWTDEQRIDNCHVPIDKRGTKPRSNACPNDPSS